MSSLNPSLPSAPAAEPGRRNSIGALRLFLAALVIYTHAFYLGGFGAERLATWSGDTMSAGVFAVQCFFVLSGWLVATSWRRQPLLGRFLWHRSLRLVPALWMCLAVTAFVFTPLLCLTARSGPVSFFNLEPSAWGYVWRNLVLPRSQIAIGSVPGGGPWPGDWNGSLWTLFYEGACYLMVAGLGLSGLLTRWRALGTALIAALLVVHVVVVFLPPSGIFAPLGRLYDTTGKLLTLHFLAGAAWAAWPQETAPLLRSTWLAVALALALGTSWHFQIHSWLSPFVLPPLLLWLSRRELLAGFESLAGGDYSYGVYLYGYPVQQVLAHFQVHQRGFAFFLAASLVLALVFAVASWHLIEKPALSLKSLAWPRLRPAAA